MTLADQLTVARVASRCRSSSLLFAGLRRPRLLGDGRLRRRDGDRLVRRPARAPLAARTSALGSLLDPGRRQGARAGDAHRAAVDDGVFPAWMVAAIVARELLVSGLRLAALERGVVIAARDLGKLKTWAQAIAAGARRPRRGRRLERRRRLVGAARRASSLTWVSGLDYARVAPRILRGRAARRPLRRARRGASFSERGQSSTRLRHAGRRLELRHARSRERSILIAVTPRSGERLGRRRSAPDRG